MSACGQCATDVGVPTSTAALCDHHRIEALEEQLKTSTDVLDTVNILFHPQYLLHTIALIKRNRAILKGDK